MSSFAPVCPPQVYKKLKAAGLLGNYHLLLAHSVANKPTEYIEVFGDGREHYIIMDNSLIELGQPVSSQVMLKACTMVRPSVIVLPDHMKNANATIKDTRESAIRWADYGLGPFMAVPQGESFAEIMMCAESHAKTPGVVALGIGRFTADMLGSRLQVAKAINREWPHMMIHLLGFSENLADDISCAQLPFVMGIDSAVPVRFGLKGIKLDMHTYPEVNCPRGDYWETEAELTDVVRLNLNLVRRWVMNDAQYMQSKKVAE
jgi:hypothetical protein